jgi:hypothetical protein
LLFLQSFCSSQALKSKCDNIREGQTEGKLRLYSRASSAFVFLSPNYRQKTVNDQARISRSSRSQERTFRQVSLMNKGASKHTKSLSVQVSSLALQHHLKPIQEQQLRNQKEKHKKILNTRASRHLTRAFPEDHERKKDLR